MHYNAPEQKPTTSSERTNHALRSSFESEQSEVNLTSCALASRDKALTSGLVQLSSNGSVGLLRALRASRALMVCGPAVGPEGFVLSYIIVSSNLFTAIHQQETSKSIDDGPSIFHVQPVKSTSCRHQRIHTFKGCSTTCRNSRRKAKAYL